MRDQDLLYWGMVVTMFLLIAALLTAREMFEQYLEAREERLAADGESGDTRQAHPPGN